MGSRASTRASLPGPPEQAEIAYLAGLLDRSGGFVATPAVVGLKIVAPPALRNWLVLRFGGSDSTRAWTLTRQADLNFLLPRLRSYLVTRVDECEAMLALLEHLAAREGYHGDDAWRQRRADLIAAVRAARSLAPRGPT